MEFPRSDERSSGVWETTIAQRYVPNAKFKSYSVNRTAAKFWNYDSLSLSLPLHVHVSYSKKHICIYFATRINCFCNSAIRQLYLYATISIENEKYQGRKKKKKKGKKKRKKRRKQWERWIWNCILRENHHDARIRLKLSFTRFYNIQCVSGADRFANFHVPLF